MLHVLDGAIVSLIRLHGEFDSKNHVTGASCPDIVSAHQELSRSLQVEESLVTELRLTACLADEQDLGHVVEV